MIHRFPHTFYRKEKQYKAQVGKQFILPQYDVVVRSVAKYVRDLADPSNLEAIMAQVFLSAETTKEDFLQRLERSTGHYKRNNVTPEGIKNLEIFVRKEKTRHPLIFLR